MTVKEIKEIFGLKPKVELPDDYIVTENDIDKGNVFQKYIHNDSVIKIVRGLKVVDGEVCYLYPDIERIEIETNDSFPACGGEQEITVYAYYVIRYKTSDKYDDVFIPEEKCIVSPLISLDNDLFSYEKPNLVNNTPNYSDENKEVNIKATYYFNGDKFESYYHVTQHINSNSSWLIEKEPTDFISLSFSDNNISGNGGFVKLKVERMFSRIYCKKDSCGNKVDEKQENGLIEDITNKAIITITNKKGFSLNENIIIVTKQLPDAEKRETIVTARYLDKATSETLYQEEGGKTTYTYELSFENGNKTELFDLQTSIPVEKSISIVSKKYKYVDGKFFNVSNTDKLKVESNSEWVKGFIIKDKYDNVYISIKAVSTNTDKENDRETTITITNAEDKDTSITLIVSQPALNVVNEEYHCDFNTNGEYTSKEIDTTDFYFESYKMLVYENGEKEKIDIEEQLQVKYEYYSTDTNLLSISSINKINNNYYIHFNNSSSYSAKDLQMMIRLLFYYNDKLLFESEKANIIVKGTDIIDYNYELCFEGHNKYKEITWDNAIEPELITINSLKYKLINGKYSDKEEIPYTIGIYNKTGREYFDDTFSIKIIKNNVLVFPVKTDKNVTNTYTVKQKETGDTIKLALSYKTNQQTYKLPLKVLVHSNNAGTDIWTGENGYLLIDKKQRINLNPCWLSPNMKDNVDTAFNGEIVLTEGIHTFETFNIISFTYQGKTHKDCNIYKEINVNENVKEITLDIFG